MSEDSTERPVKITSTPREHPAIRAIARACIAFARWQREQKTNSPAKTTSRQTSQRRPQIDAPGEGARHD